MTKPSSSGPFGIYDGAERVEVGGKCPENKESTAGTWTWLEK